MKAAELINVDPVAAARGIDALRRGWAVRIGALTLVAVETLWGELPPSTGILLSASRAATLKLVNQRDAGDTALPVLIAPPEGLDIALVRAIADPTFDLDWPMKGPFAALPLAYPDDALAALELARLAGVLPALLLVESEPAARLAPADIAALTDPARLAIAARARLPVVGAEDAELVAFRSVDDPADHVALIVGKRDSSVPLVRLHSECLTGDVLGSLKCDCGPQLHEALRLIGGATWGVLLYLRQEGRGIGLVNKLRAYALQDQGYDTVDANIRLGFAVDVRDFGVAARMLDLVGIDTVRLLTNNPAKVAGLQAAGVTVAERVALALPANPYNERYLATKRDRTGHQL